MLQATTLRYVTSFVKFTYWRKYEVSKSQKYSKVKHPAAWGCHPAALLQGGPVHERWEEVGSTFGTPVTPKGHKLGGKEAGEAKQKMAPRTWHSETQSERRGPLESGEYFVTTRVPAVRQGLLHPYSLALAQIACNWWYASEPC